MGVNSCKNENNFIPQKLEKWQNNFSSMGFNRLLKTFFLHIEEAKFYTINVQKFCAEITKFLHLNFKMGLLKFFWGSRVFYETREYKITKHQSYESQNPAKNWDINTRVIHFFQKCQFSLLLSTFLNIWDPQSPKMSILAQSEVVCLCSKGHLFCIVNIILHKLSPNKDGSCCIGKPSPIELKLTFLDSVGPKCSEKSRGARKIDTFGKSESP